LHQVEFHVIKTGAVPSVFLDATHTEPVVGIRIGIHAARVAVEVLATRSIPPVAVGTPIVPRAIADVVVAGESANTILSKQLICGLR
jgi:hypothetical protein